MNAADISETVVDKRKMFVTMGCQLFPYSRIKELLGEKGSANFHEFMQLPILDDEKIVAIEELDFFPAPMMRMLALRHARSTFRSLSPLLDADDRIEGQHALDCTQQFLFAEISREELDATKRNLQDLINRLIEKGVEENKARIGCLEVILSVTKWSAQGALREASSIQRDLLGEAAGKEQLLAMRDMSAHLYDLKP